MKRALRDDATSGFPDEDQDDPVSGFPDEDQELVRLLIQAARDEIHIDYERAHDPRYGAFLLHIKNNLTRSRLTVDRAKNAGNLGGVASYSTQFKRIVGMRPRDYIEHHRIRLARRIIQHTGTGVHIYTIAFAVGYKDQAQFSNFYGKKIGYPPGQEIKQI